MGASLELRPQETPLEVLRPGWPALAVLMLAVVMLNIFTPLGTADPYHLQRAERIGFVGTLVYDPSVHPKLNVLGWLYQLLLADVAAMPVLGGLMLRLHGAAGLVFFALTIGAVMHLLGRRRVSGGVCCCRFRRCFISSSW